MIRADCNSHSLDHAFREWLTDSAARIGVGLRVEKLPSATLDISFEGVIRAVGAVVNYEDENPFVELEVFVDWQDRNWDLLLELQCEPLQSEAGYVCALCAPAEQRVFPDREALWRDHLFEPFLEWINTDLSQADVIGLHGSPSEGYTRAALYRASTIPTNDPPRICVPLRTTDAQ